MDGDRINNEIENEATGDATIERQKPVLREPSEGRGELIFSTDGTKTFQRLSFEEAEREEREMYLAMTPQQRLDLQAQLIMMFYGPNPPKLEREFEIIYTPKDPNSPNT